MQGTVASFDPDRRAGSVRLDDGRAVTFPAAAFDASGLRLLRPGQRVTVQADPEGVVTLVTLPTLYEDVTETSS